MSYLYHGNPVPLLILPVNWNRSVKLGVMCKNLVREALTTDEERQCVQPRSLYSLEYTTLTLDADATARMRGFLEAPEPMPVAVPLWPEAVHLARPYNPAEDFLWTDDNCLVTETLWEVFLGSCLIYSSETNWEVFQASATNANGITLPADLVNSYPEGSLVVPLMVGFLSRDHTKALTDEHATYQVKFRETFHLLYGQSTRELTFTDGLPATLRAFALADKTLLTSLFGTGSHLITYVETPHQLDKLTFRGGFSVGELLSVYTTNNSQDKALLKSLFSTGTHQNSLQSVSFANYSNVAVIFAQGNHAKVIVVAEMKLVSPRGFDQANLVNGFKTGSHSP